MAKIRIHELAKELVESNAVKESKSINGDIVKLLQDKGFDVKNHMSSIGDEEIAYVRNHFASSGSSAADVKKEAPVSGQKGADEVKPAEALRQAVNSEARPVRPQRPEGQRPAAGPDGRPLRPRPVMGPDGRPVMGPDGRPVRPQRPMSEADGRPVRPQRPDGQRYMMGPDGRPALGPDGRPLRPRPDGQRPVMGPDGRPVRPQRPDGQRYMVGPDGRPAIGPGGRPLRPRPDGQRPVMGPDGRPVRPQRPDGQRPAVGPDGRPVQGMRPQNGERKIPQDVRNQSFDGRPASFERKPAREQQSSGIQNKPVQPKAPEKIDAADKPVQEEKVLLQEDSTIEVGNAQVEQDVTIEAAPKKEVHAAEERPQDAGRVKSDNGRERQKNNNGQRNNDRQQRNSYGDKPRYGDRNQSGNYGDRPRYGAQGDRPAGDRSSYGDRQQRNNYGDRPRYGDRNQGGNYGDRPRYGAQGDRPAGDRPAYGDRRGGASGFNKDKEFDKDSAQRNQRGFSRQRNDGRAEKSNIKVDLANEFNKEQRAAALNDRSRDKNKKDRDRDHDDDIRSAKNKKDPNRKGAFIMPKPQPVAEEKPDEIKTIVIPEVITIKELADAMKQSSAAIIKKLFMSGKMVSINSEITFEEAEEIALEYNCICEKEVKVNIVEELLREEEEDPATMVKRPPVVCVMGHVDHGKTSLLDAIRATNVTAREAGGITQHIGAYVVEINGESITFLDTPGHEAFTSMRMRGAKSTDIAILVVAADDGVMPQTVEAINHAKAANVQIIVAINKIDKPGANVERVKQELTEHGLVAEDWGGDTVFVPVSAKTHEGIEQLLEMILLTAEVCELKANPDRKARGIVIEAELDKGRGPVATLLIQKGTLHVGDNVVIGSAHGKVRAMMDDKGRRVKTAGPSTAVEIIGLNGVPDAGEVIMAVSDEKEARTIAEAFISQGKEKLIADTKAKLSLDGLFSQIQAGNVKELNLIIKADVMGSVEAVKQSLVKLSNEEVVVRVIHGGVGNINESDVNLASASSAIIIGFNVKPDNTAKDTAEREKVEIKLYKVIYNAINDIEAAMKGMLKPIYQEKVIGHAEIRQIFKASGLGNIAGSFVLDGKIERGCLTRISREGKLIFEGPLASLKRFKDDVKEVNAGYECGLVFEKYNDVQELDQVEFYIMEEVPRT